jgi:hypothetical protein
VEKEAYLIKEIFKYQNITPVTNLKNYDNIRRDESIYKEQINYVHKLINQLLIRINEFGNGGLTISWFCIWDDLLRLLAIARVANPKVELI